MNTMTSVKRWLIGIVVAALLLAALVIAWQFASDPDASSTIPRIDDAALIERGAYLARAGNCIACHTQRGGAPYAGGRAIMTPFGDVYTTNITPDKATGIGDWSADDFWRAMHNGRARDGSFLYPAFPYPNFTKITREDSDALYVYLRHVAPVAQADRAHELRFPFSQRILLAFWRALYFRPGTFTADASQSADWNRGAYLVQGLGHCAACHTPRNALGATMADHTLAGAVIPVQNWHASSLNANPVTGLGAWQVDELATLLKTGVSDQSAVFGPMAEVVGKSLQHLSDQDIHAMATYLKSVPDTGPVDKPMAAKPGPEAEASLQRGAKLYDKHCADCHGADGKGKAPAYPPLTGRVSLSEASAVNTIRIVLSGGFPPSTNGNPRPYGMPPFGFMLNDDEVADVVSYVRSRWGRQGMLVPANEVARFRGVSKD